MPVTLDSIYKPVNDFFLKKFNTGADSSIFFRFDKFGSVISDEDFLNPQSNPDEVFSDFVNRIPVEDADGLSVVFSDKKIDQSYYYELLSPALPFIPAGTDAAAGESIASAFSKIHAQGVRQFDMLWQARTGSVADKFWCSEATPGKWYDKADTGIWEHFNFKAAEDVPVADPAAVKPGLWKLRLNDDHFTNIFPALSEKEIQPEVALVNTVNPALLSDIHFGKQHTAASAMNVRRGQLKGAAFRPQMNIIKPPQQNIVSSNMVRNTMLRQDFHKAFYNLDLVKRVAVANYIKTEAPAKPVSSDNIVIDFDYCVVNIRRPWLFEVFLESSGWYIPGTLKGKFNSAGNLAMMPVSFVAVKNLSIHAQWSDDDKQNAANATDFGPFQVDSKMYNGQSIGHDGIQVVGWIMHRTNQLPPNDAAV